MENFILYNAASEKNQVTFEASWVHIQRIALGTDEMIAEMLGTLGVTDRKVEQWELRKYLTNYLSDEPESDDWETAWIETAEIVATLDRPAKLNVKETDLARTYARDTTWRASTPLKLPAECVVVADFYKEGVLDDAELRIRGLGKKEGATVSFGKWAAFPRKLKVRLGAFPETFFVEGAPLAHEVMVICSDLGGTTNWNERIAPEHISP